MKTTIAAALFSLALTLNAAPVCTIGSGQHAWSGSPSDLAVIQSVWEREAAEKARQPFPNGAPESAPWSSLVVCSESPASR